MKSSRFYIIFISKKVGTTFLVWIVQIYIKMVEVISRNLNKCVSPRRNLPSKFLGCFLPGGSIDYEGEAVYDDFQTLVVPDPEADNPCDIYVRSVEALNELYALKVQVEYERFNFREATQLHDESLDQFVTQLKKYAATCDFTDTHAEIKSQVIQKVIETSDQSAGWHNEHPWPASEHWQSCGKVN